MDLLFDFIILLGEIADYQDLPEVVEHRTYKGFFFGFEFHLFGEPHGYHAARERREGQFL
ncbi:MAG: hypothetical protein A4E66_02439 [Syntrophus sp. PtaB.Bin001]|nr:MAG: hypothetical protein A4E66_02439 [Syntrophus sp. PtaB.Bin001]